MKRVTISDSRFDKRREDENLAFGKKKTNQVNVFLTIQDF